MTFSGFMNETSKKSELSEFPKDIQAVIKRLPIRDPKIVELSSTTASVSVEMGMLFHDDLAEIIKVSKKYTPYISVRNNKLILSFTL